MMFPHDPLMAYHTMLRLGRSSGYSNLQYGAPHPYAMALSAAVSPLGGGMPFQAMQGRMMQHTGAGGLRSQQPIGTDMNRTLGPVLGGIRPLRGGRGRTGDVRLAPGTLFARRLRR